MANDVPQLFEVDLADPESNKTHTIVVTFDEYKRLKTDYNFASCKLEEVKNLECAQSINEDEENFEAVQPNSLGDGSVDESRKITNEDSAFKWPHETILLLLDEYQKRETDFNSGKISQKNLWREISGQIQAHGHNITGLQCQSKLSGTKKTYKKIKDHNNKSGNSAKHWPYTTLMDDLMGDKPFISPVAICSSTSKKRTLSEGSSRSSTSCDSDYLVNHKKEKITPANKLITILEERSIKSEENKKRRFKEFMAFKAQKAEEALRYKKRALDLLEKLVNSNSSL